MTNFRPSTLPPRHAFVAAGLDAELDLLVERGLAQDRDGVDWSPFGQTLLAGAGPDLRALRQARDLKLEALVDSLLSWLASPDSAPSLRRPSYKIASRTERDERTPTVEELITWIRATAPERLLKVFTIEGEPLRLDPDLDEPRTALCCSVARSVGDWLMEEYVHGDRVAEVVSPAEVKAIVTEADCRGYERLKAMIAERFPHDVVGGEEETDWADRVEDGRVLWLGDTIDGTINFAKGLASWCVALAAGRWNAETRTLEPICAAVYNPPTGEMFWAGVDRGAWLTRTTKAGRRARLLQTSSVRRAEHAVVMTHLSASHTAAMERFVDSGLLTALGRIARRVLMIGSGQLALCAVASGRAEGYLVGRTNAWDVLAGKVILDEVGNGGRGAPQLTGYDLRPWTLQSPGVVASANEVIHGTLSGLIRGLKG